MVVVVLVVIIIVVVVGGGFFFFFSTWCEPHTLETRGDKLYNRVFTRAHVQHRPLDGLV